MNKNIDFTIRATSNLMQLFLLIFCWIIAIASYFFTENEIVVIFLFGVSLGLTLWLLRVFIKINNGKLIYNSGWKKKELDIAEIAVIKTSALGGGSAERMIGIITRNDEMIKFNTRNFSKRDVVKLMIVLDNLNKDIEYDEFCLKLLQ
jgi:hypothetical protein